MNNPAIFVQECHSSEYTQDYIISDEEEDTGDDFLMDGISFEYQGHP